MKTVILCHIPMKPQVASTVYAPGDTGLTVSPTPVRYPISAAFAGLFTKDDDLTVIRLVKKDAHGHYEENAKLLEQELREANAAVGAALHFSTISTDFVQTRQVHSALLGAIIDAIPDGARIISDITYGPKDLPIVVFAALGFAERSLGCRVQQILYGQADFQDGRVVSTQLCDMSPLYTLSAVAATVCGDEPTRARKTLKALMQL